jgi:[ribosomal protein S5]-alanine N-acetyltransferase
MPAFDDLVEPLRGELVALRFVSERDIPETLIAHQDDPQLHVQLGEDRPPSGAELGRRAELAAAERAAGVRAALAILTDDSEDCCGQIDVHGVDWEHERASLGIWVAPGSRRKGLARAALRLAADWLFSANGLRRVQLLTEPGNEPMLRAARAAGFTEEGVLRSYGRERGGRVDLVVLSLIPADLQAR